MTMLVNMLYTLHAGVLPSDMFPPVIYYKWAVIQPIRNRFACYVYPFCDVVLSEPVVCRDFYDAVDFVNQAVGEW